MKGLGAGGRLWELLERQPQLPFNGGYTVGLFVVSTVRLTFCPPQGMGHCQEVAPAAKQGGQGSHGTLMDTLQGMLWKCEADERHAMLHIHLQPVIITKGRIAASMPGVQEHPDGLPESSLVILTFVRGWGKRT